MSYLNKYALRAREMAYARFFLHGYTREQAEFYAKEFVKFAIEHFGTRLEDLLVDFINDVRYSEAAEADKERSLYA